MLDHRTIIIRAEPAPFAQGKNRSHQVWYEDMIDHNWRISKQATKRLLDGLPTRRWADEFFDAILQANANAHWIGRDLVSQIETEFSEELDALAARGIADNDAEYLLKFIDDIEEGKYTLDDGSFNESAILNRQRLYLGRARGLAGQASVDALEPQTEIFWRLGGNEKHCADCPVLASISPFFKDDLFATPGSCDTPCLGNCKCHLEFKINGQNVQTIRPVSLEI